MSVSIESEDDVVIYLGKRFKRPLIEVFPKVNIIARNIMVSPDIDLLVIDRVNEKTIGYEVKLLRYRKNWKKFDYKPIYTGIGQALSYRLYGIDEAYLIITHHKNEAIPEIGQKKLSDKIKDIANSFIFTNINNFLGLSLLTIEPQLAYSKDIIQVKGVYLSKPEDFDYRRKCILKKEFSYNKHLYKKIFQK